jgi:hypothetical protein
LNRLETDSNLNIRIAQTAKELILSSKELTNAFCSGRHETAQTIMDLQHHPWADVLAMQLSSERISSIKELKKQTHAVETVAHAKLELKSGTPYTLWTTHGQVVALDVKNDPEKLAGVSMEYTISEQTQKIPDLHLWSLFTHSTAEVRILLPAVYGRVQFTTERDTTIHLIRTAFAPKDILVREVYRRYSYGIVPVEKTEHIVSRGPAESFWVYSPTFEDSVESITVRMKGISKKFDANDCRLYDPTRTAAQADAYLPSVLINLVAAYLGCPIINKLMERNVHMIDFAPYMIDTSTKSVYAEVGETTSFNQISDPTVITLSVKSKKPVVVGMMCANILMTRGTASILRFNDG